MLPVFFMVTETGYFWPAFMDEGIVLDTTCALTAETLTVPLSTSMDFEARDPNHSCPSHTIRYRG